MKRMLVSICFLAVLGLFVPAARAQTNFIFSSFQCDPSSCIDETPIPVFQGLALVTFDSTCTGGAITGISGRAKAVVGDIGQCRDPYTPHAEIDRYRSTYLDDCGNPYSVDSETEIAEIKNAGGAIVFLDEAGVSCDGGTTGPTSNGSRPC